MNGPIVFALVVVAVMVWFAGMYAMAHLGGWSALAKQFRATGLPAAKAYRFSSGSVGMAHYGASLTLRPTDAGLHISAGLFGAPILPAHPPLLIPWSQFHSTTKRTILGWSTTVTYVGMPVVSQMTLPGWVADYIIGEEQPTMCGR